MDGSGSPNTKKRPRTPPRPVANISPRTSPRPPIPKKPPIAHVKPMTPRGHLSPGTPPTTRNSPKASHDTIAEKTPPPLPKVPPKGGNGPNTKGESPPSGKKGSPLPNGSLQKGTLDKEAQGSPDPEDSENVETSVTQLNSSGSSKNSSPGRNNTSALSKSGISDLGNLSLNAAETFFDEVMSALDQKNEESKSEEQFGDLPEQVSCLSKAEKTETDSKTCVIPNEKGDADHSENSQNAVEKEPEKKMCLLSPSTGRPKPKKRLSLTNSGETPTTEEKGRDGKSKTERPALKPKPKPVPRKRLPMPNLIGITKQEKNQVSSGNSDGENDDNVTCSTPLPFVVPQSPAPIIPSKLKARCKGRLSLDTFFPRRSLSTKQESCESPLNASFSFGDSSDYDDTPRRPPRPRRLKTLLSMNSSSQDLTPCSKSFDVGMLTQPDNWDDTVGHSLSLVDSPSSSRKCPPKPKRKTLPSRSNRSFSDVSSAAGFMSHMANKDNLQNGKQLHSPVLKSLSDSTDSRLRSQTVDDTTSVSNAENDDSKNLKSHSHWTQRVNPFNTNPSSVTEQPDFHVEMLNHNDSKSNMHDSSKEVSTPSKGIKPPDSKKNSTSPAVKLKPVRPAPKPPSQPPETEVNNNIDDQEYEIPISLSSPEKVSPSKSVGSDFKNNADNVKVSENNSNNSPTVPPRVSLNRQSVLDLSPPPPCAPPRSGKGAREEEDDGYIYPQDVPVEFAESANWPKNKIIRPQSAHVGSSDLSKFQHSEMPGSPRTMAKLKHLSLMSEGSSQSDHSSDSQNRLSSYFIENSSSEDSVAGTERTGPKREKLYYIVEEIVKSEKIFVDVLRLMNVEFRMAVSEATEKHGKPVIANETLNRILDFLPQLQNFNEDLLKDFTERLNNWDQEKKVADIFVKKGPFLKLYTSYIKNFETMTELLQKSCEKNPTFAAVVKEFERNIGQSDLSNRKTLSITRPVQPNMSPRCASLALRHYMLKPIQRIPQYKLLLQDYKKHLPADSPDVRDTDTAISIVSEVANHANESMRYGDTVQKMLSIQHSLIGQFEVIKPGRTLMKQGELLKLSRKEMQPRMFFLFSDVLLYTTPVAGGYKLNNVLSLTSMKVRKVSQEEYKNEFSIISVQRSFSLATRTAEEKSEWMTALQSAIEENAHKRSTFDFGRINSQPDLTRDFTLGNKAPVWIPDSRVTMCMLCTGEFTVTWRRHHCRACGKVVCGSCSENRAPLQYLDYKINRVCDECFENLQDDIEQRSKSSSLGRGESLEQTETGSLSIAGIKARFLQIRRSARTFRGSGPKKRPAVLKEVSANDHRSTMSGYLKQHKGKKWRKLWFVIKDKVLYTYKASEDMAAVESYPLLGYEVVRVSEYYDGFEAGLVFQCKHKNTDPLVFRTESPSATDKWIEMMREASVP